MNKYIINKSNGSTFDLYNLEQNGVGAVPTTRQLIGTTLGAPGVNSFKIVGDYTYRFVVAFTFDILGSSGGLNDGTYTVTNSSFDGTDTIIVVNETIAANGLPLGHVSYTIPTAENATSLLLSGRGVVNFGESLVENSVRLLENFSSATSPAHPNVGQLWYNPTTDEMSRYDSSLIWTTSINLGAGDLTFVDPQHPTDTTNPIIVMSGDDSDVGASLQMTVDPADYDSIFRVLSANGSERLRVEHEGYVDTTNAFRSTSTTNLNHFDNSLEFINSKGILSASGASIVTKDASGFTWEITGSSNASDTLTVHHADSTLLLSAKADKTIESAVDFLVNTDTFYVDVSADSVGVGTATPSETLDVVGNSQVSGQILASNGTLALPSVSFTNNTSVGMRLNGVNGIGFVTTGAEKFNILQNSVNSTVDFSVNTDTFFVDISADSVGVGTVTPSETLDVVGNSQVSGQILASDGTLALPSLAFTNNPDVGLRLTGGNDISFVSDATEIMVVNSTGVVSVSDATYETLVVDDNDVPNKKYVDDEITTLSNAVAGSYLLQSGDTVASLSGLVGSVGHSDGVLKFTDNLGSVGVLFLNEGQGSTGAAPDIRALDSMLISADDGVSINVDGSNTSSGDFVINKGAHETLTDVELFKVENDGTLHVGTASYETLVLANNDIPNKKFVDDEILAAVNALIAGSIPSPAKQYFFGFGG